MIMYLLFRIDSVVGCSWPCHCLTLENTVSRCEISAEGIVNHLLPVLTIFLITKGVVFELNAFQMNCSFSWICFYECLTLMANDVLPLMMMAVELLVFRLNKERSELSHNKHGDQISLLFQEPFLYNRVYLQQNTYKQVMIVQKCSKRL